jgi:HEPN domain-containing protein
MNKSEKVKYWLDIAEYDLETAKAMLKTKRYLYVGFMCHQVIEKILKAYYCKIFDDIPPFTHNLKRLSDITGLTENLTPEQTEFLIEILPLNIEARYPTYKDEIYKMLTKEKTNEIILKTEDFKEWIKSLL